MSIRQLNPLDVPRYMFLGQSRKIDHAHPLNRLSIKSNANLSVVASTKLSIPVHVNGFCALTWTNGKEILGIAAAMPRSGYRSWEISHMLLSSDDNTGGGELLRSLCQSIAQHGGERVFIRLRADDPLVQSTITHGFTLCQYEQIYFGVPKQSARNQCSTLRKKSPSDDYSLYRLYNQTVPLKIRKALGMTFDQWSSSREKSYGFEYLLLNNDLVAGWARTVQHLVGGGLMMMVHPDYEAETSEIMLSSLMRISRAKVVWLLVPEYQNLLQRILVQNSFQLSSKYVTLSKSMVAPFTKENIPAAITIPSL